MDKVQTTAKHFGDVGHGRYTGLCAPLTNEQTSNDKEKRHGAKVVVGLRRVQPGGYGAPWRF